MWDQPTWCEYGRLRRKDDVESGITDTIGAKTTMSLDIIGSAAIVRNLNIGMTTGIGMLIVLFGENLGLRMRAVAWSTLSQESPEQEA